MPGTLINVPDSAYLDPAWVNENAESLYEQIEQEIRDPKTLSTAVKRITLMMPRLIGREDIRQWVRLSESALRKMNLDVSTRDPRRPEYTFGSDYVLKRLDHTTPIIQRAKRRRHRISPRKIYETYLILLMGLYYRNELSITPEVIDDMLAFARVVNDQHIYHKVYQTLSVVLTQSQSNGRAILFGEIAYKYFESVNNQLEMALSAHALARAHYLAQDWEKTKHWLDQAADLFVPEQYPRQYGAVAVLQGLMFLLNKQYVAAEQWLKKALGEYRLLGDKLRVPDIRYYLALTQINIGNVEVAIENVSQAIECYRDQQATDRESYALVVLALIQGKDGAYDRASESIAMAKSLRHSLEEIQIDNLEEIPIERLVSSRKDMFHGPPPAA